MRSRRPSPEHQEAVSRRLALLSEQLAAARDEPVEEPQPAGRRRVVGRAHPGGAAASGAARGAEPGTSRAGRPARAPEPARAGRSREPGGGARARAARRPAARWRGRRCCPRPCAGGWRWGRDRSPWSRSLVALALAWTCWQVVRDDPAPPVPVAAADGGRPATSCRSATPPLPAPAAPCRRGPAGPRRRRTVTVDVAGRVRRPGIVVLDAGSRVVDALEEAGGARPAVDLTTLNLARPLVDGEQILVGVGGRRGPAAGPGRAGAGRCAPAAPAALVDLNLADAVAARGAARGRPGDGGGHRGRGATSTAGSARSPSCSRSTASATPPSRTLTPLVTV